MAAFSDGGDFRDYTWLDHVSAAVRLPRPRSNVELAALLDAAFAQDLSCLMKPLPLVRAPRIDDTVDIDALLLSTWPDAQIDGRFGAACAPSYARDCGSASSAVSTRVDCQASDICELIGELEVGLGCEVDGRRRGLLPQRSGHESLEM